MPPRTSEGKVVVITGAGSGIGRAVSLEAARCGYAVVAVSKQQDHLDDLRREMELLRRACVYLTADVMRPQAPARIVSLARESFGQIDVLLNNAGFATAGALLDQSDATVELQWQVHAAAPLRILRAAFPMLRERRGQVLFMGSGLARVPAPYYGGYPAAKAAIRAMSSQLRRELHGTGVAVTYVDPGSVRTNFARTAGIAPYGPRWASVEPEVVARRIVRAFRTRPSRLNAVPLHALAATLGEWFPHFTDMSFKNARPPVTPEPVEDVLPEPAEQSDFERALEPVARRMERVKLPAAFLEELLRPGETIQLTDAAMRWAGMPNKNERAAMAEALEALTAGGFLEKTGEESWRVVRPVCRVL
jgi:short-subunit dehydrogenase